MGQEPTQRIYRRTFHRPKMLQATDPVWKGAFSYAMIHIFTRLDVAFDKVKLVDVVVFLQRFHHVDVRNKSGAQLWWHKLRVVTLFTCMREFSPQEMMHRTAPTKTRTVRCGSGQLYDTMTLPAQPANVSG